MNGINKAIIVGTLGRDPEIRQSNNGDTIANLSVATSEKWRDKKSGDMQERTEWHRVSLFGAVADVAGKYLKRGSAVYIEGKIQTRKWQDKDGQDRYTTEIVGRDMQMLGGKSESGGREGPQQSRQQGGSNTGGFDDDIPFISCEFSYDDGIKRRNKWK